MKFFFKIILFFTLLIWMWSSLSFADENITIWWSISNTTVNDSLLGIFTDPNYFTISNKWEKWIVTLLFRIAKDAKDLFFYIASLYFFILVYKLLASWKSEEELWNFKHWIIWISIGIVVMQISYSFVKLLYDKWVSERLASNLVEKMILPLVNVLETWASFFFLAMAVYTFFKLVTAGWNEESVKTWKMTIVYSILWFIVVRFTRTLVEAIYWKLNCPILLGWGCIRDPNLSWFVGIIADIINWANWFIWVITVILIIYAWYNILFSWWNEEMLKKSKSIILYIAVGILLLVINYMILTFFIIPDGTIW